MSELAIPSFTINAIENWRCAWKVMNTNEFEHIKTSTFDTDDLAMWPPLEKLVFILPINLLCIIPSWFSFKHLWEYPRFHYKEDKINEWFVQDFASEEGEKKAINIINVDQDGRRRKSYTDVQIANFPESLANDQFEVFFHGTSQGNAANIIENGILLKKGKEAQDFSDRNGFYVTNNFQEADQWARENCREKQAVLVYLLDRMKLRGENGLNDLDLREDKAKWLEVVKEFRCAGKVNRKSHKEIAKQYDFIEGPQARLSANSSHPRQKEGSHALCVRSARCVHLFNGGLCNVIFFER